MAKLIPPADPTRTKADKLMANKLRMEKMPLDWWKAQCPFRGMSIAGKIGELQARMRAALNANMTQEICDLQERSNKEYRIKNAEAGCRKGSVRSLSTSNKKRIQNVF
jgi:hypothetical protein